MEQSEYIENKTGHMAPERLLDEPMPDDFASGGRVPLDEGGISDSRVGMIFGGGIYKTIIKNLAKDKGVTPSYYLKVTNYKTLPREVRNLMSKADFEKMKAGRLEMFENLVEMAKTRKEFLKNIEQGKKTPAAPIFEHLEKSFKSPVPSGVTDKDILQGEFILKNLKTKGRKLNATGGRVPFVKGKIAKYTTPEGLAELIEKLFPGTTKLGQTSKPMAPKTQLKQAIAGFQEREKAAKLKEMIKNKYQGRIDDDLLNKMLVDDNPQRIAEVMATIDEALLMQGKGMGPDEIIHTFKESWKRKPQASGGVAGMLGE